MKTSNKLLCLGAVILVFLMLAGTLYTKNNMIVTRYDEGAKGNGVMKTTLIVTELHSNRLKLDGNFNFILDPNSKGVSVTMDENLTNEIKASDNGTLVLYREGDLNFTPSQPLEVSIGIEGKANLIIELDDNATLRSGAEIIANLKIMAEDNVSVTLDLYNSMTEIRAENNVEISLRGQTEMLQVTEEDEVRIEAKNLKVNDMKANLSDFSTLFIDQASIVNLTLEDGAVVDFNKKWNDGKFTFKDNAQINVDGNKVESK